MSITTDRFSGQHSHCAPAALDAWERAVNNFAAHKPFQSELQEILSHEPLMTAAHALHGLAAALMGRAHGLAAARASLTAARSGLAATDGGTPFERTLVHALQAAAFGRLKRAAAHLECYLDEHPTDLLILKLAHACRFMTGQTADMLRTTGAVLPSWNEATPGYGFALGCRAFALEETGYPTAAEALGRRAVFHQPDDVWGLHAVAHVMEMAGRTREGRLWLGAAHAHFGPCGVFGQHLLWHLALFHLSEGDGNAALALFDAGIKPSREGDFRDVANAVSLLWRLEQEGIDVGPRWHALHEIAHERRLDSTYAFASLHYLMTLIAARDERGAADCVNQMRRRSHGDVNDQSAVLARIGVPLAEALMAAGRDDRRKRRLGELARDLPLLGGSRAQQDVFMRSLMMIAANDGDAAALSSLIAVRRAHKADDRFQAVVARRIRQTAVQIPA